ncbi:hypothetical protein [Paraglaciecola aestuariivivens]
MKYSFFLPFSALIVVLGFAAIENYSILPNGLTLLKQLQQTFDGYFYAVIVCIILLESIVYVGFYFPGQFFAVLLVVLANPQAKDLAYLTLAMVVAATLGSYINYHLGRLWPQSTTQAGKVSVKKLLLAMIHINSLAFFMFHQGATQQSKKVIFLAALLNLPYYLMLIWATSVFSQEVLQMAENTWLLATIVSIWLAISVYLDLRNKPSKT